jgi:RNA polymerase sigma factor (TIGR02999 family)
VTPAAPPKPAARPGRVALPTGGPMPAVQPHEITRMLIDASGGNRDAFDKLLPIVYAELRRVARRQLSHERTGHTLDSVALVHEAYLKLIVQGSVQWQNRAHFFAIAARAMRGILVDHARARSAAKRNGGAVAVSLDDVPDIMSDERAEHLIALDEALGRLAEVNDEACQLVECRYFAGLTLEEAAVVLGLSVATARRRWDFAKVWLKRELGEAGLGQGA